MAVHPSLVKRDKYLQYKYGITLKQYNDLLDKQDGVCYICRRSPKQVGHNLHVDHDHKTMVIRGLLCTFCNRRVIGRHRDPVLFTRAASYLLGPSHRGAPTYIVPTKKKKRKKRKRK